MADDVTFYGPVTIYVRKERSEWAAYVDPFSVAGEGRTSDEAVKSAIRNLTELLRILAADIRKHGQSNVQILCPLKAAQKRNAKKLEGLLWAAGKPIRARIPSAPAEVRPFSKRTVRRVLATSASIGVVPPVCLTT